MVNLQYWLNINNITVLLIFIFSIAVFAEDNKITLENDYPEDILVVRATMKPNALLSDGILCIEKDLNNNQVFISLSEFLNVIEFQINVMPEEGEARGWFIERNRTFHLNLKESFVEISNHKMALNNSELLWYEDDIFVSQLLLKQWFELTTIYNHKKLHLDVSAKEILPFQKRWKRESTREKLNQLKTSKNDTESESSIKTLKSSYNIISPPALSLNINSTLLNKKNKNSANSNYNYSGKLDNDLLYHNSTLIFNGEQGKGVTDAKIKVI